VNAFVQLQSKSDRATGAKGEQICAPQIREAHIKQGLTAPALNRKVSTAVPQPCWPWPKGEHFCADSPETLAPGLAQRQAREARQHAMQILNSSV